MKRLRSPTSLLSAFLARLSPGEREWMTLLGRIAGEHGSDLYLAGGSVRDLLLGRAHLDLDLVVEADAPTVARQFARRTGTKAVPHDAFRTAVVSGDRGTFDIVTARREAYREPGALPVVTPSALADDLARRDFTINAMALALTGRRAGALIDPHGGRADLAAGVLRALHPDSFRDDATRTWRAGRYVARLAMRLAPETEAALRRDARYVETISPARIHAEIARTLDEQAPWRALRLLDGWGVLVATFPALHCSRADAAALPRLGALAPREMHAASLAAIAHDWDAVTAEAGAERLGLTRPERTALLALPHARATLARLVSARATPGTAAPLLDRLPEAALAALAARHPRRRCGRMAQQYLVHWRSVRPLLTAADLQRMGIAPGPRMGAILARLRAARLDGTAPSLDDEIRLVHTVLGDGAA